VAFNKVEGNRSFSNICVRKKKDDRTEKTWWIPLQNALFLGSFRNFLAMTKKLLVPPKKKSQPQHFQLLHLPVSYKSSYISGFSHRARN